MTGVTILQILELVFFAALAGAVLFSLYAVLGKRVGRQPEERASLGRPSRMLEPAPPPPEPVDGVALSGLAAVKAKDPAFEVDVFLRGARTAYETIVKAFAANDRQTLQPLVTPEVYAAFEAAIVEREKSGLTETVDFLNPARADLESADMGEQQLSLRVRFLSEFRTTTKRADQTEPSTDERRTAESWTFVRPASSQDPNWTLARVEAAET
jgi:predicted lipid-binding transport protein (Tim44 family)